MKLSVVLPTYRLRDRIAVTLRALEAQTLDASAFELVFVDDASDDGTADVVEASPTRLHRQVLRNTTNRGRSATRNLGVRSSSGDVIVFLDGDMIPHPDLLRTYHQRFAAGGCDVVSGLRRSIDLTARPAQDGHAIAALAGRPLAALFDDPFADYERLRAHSVVGQLPTTLGMRIEAEVEAVCRDYAGTLTCALALITSNVAVTREAFGRTRGFFPGLARGEDTDLGLQLALAGARFASAQDAEAIHPYETSYARDDTSSFATLLARHPFIQLVLWWCWAASPDEAPSLTAIAQAEADGTVGDFDWQALARRYRVPVNARADFTAAAIRDYWTSVYGIAETAAVGYLERAVSQNVLHRRQDGETLFDLPAIASWLADHTDFRQHMFQRSMFSQRGAVPARPSAPRTFRWQGRYEVEIAAQLLEGGAAVINVPLPVVTRCQREVELFDWDPPELAQHVVDGMIMGYPLADAGAPSIRVGYSFRCLVSEFDRNSPADEPGDRDLWLRPLSFAEHRELERVLAMTRAGDATGPAERARAIYEWMLRATEHRNNASHLMSAARTGLGHCIQLARLFVALCRLAGIPARERCGVLVDRVRAGGGELAAETAEWFSPFAHTWAEFLCPERGWTPVELMPIAHGRRIVTAHNFPDAAQRDRVITEGDAFDTFYFAGLDAFRVHGSEWANELPTLARDRGGWETVPDPALTLRHRISFDGERVA